MISLNRECVHFIHLFGFRAPADAKRVKTRKTTSAAPATATFAGENREAYVGQFFSLRRTARSCVAAFFVLK